jgi:dTDP-4-amino-4,6-dideoxygalactose transaminase
VNDRSATQREPSTSRSLITFNRLRLRGAELRYLAEAIENGRLSGNGPFTKRCHELLKNALASQSVLLTHSGTAALEMAALLIEIGPGDEIILPSFTFVSTANAFVLRGATPIFADIRPDTLNIDETLLHELVTERTKAVVPVHYAGVACALDEISEFTAKHGLFMIEDAAQAVGARYKSRPLGSIGDFGCLSFHETKNVLSGEGGALAVKNPATATRAEIIWEKGTDRAKFYRGEVDRYTWRDVGSSYLPGELTAAFLLGQLEHLSSLTEHRRAIWTRYHELLQPLEEEGMVRRPAPTPDCEYNGHLYWVLLPKGLDRAHLLRRMTNMGVNAVSHYEPLHSSPAGQRFGRSPLPLSITEDIAPRLIRLPLHTEVTADDQLRVVDTLRHCIDSNI